MHKILFYLLILVSFSLFLFVFIHPGYCLSAPGAVSGWVKAFPLKDGSRQIQLQWDAVSGAEKYYIYRDSFAKGGTPPSDPPSQTDLNPTEATQASYTDTGLSNNYWYIYQVSAYDIDTSTESDASPATSYGIFIPEVRLKWEEYTE